MKIMILCYAFLTGFREYLERWHMSSYMTVSKLSKTTLGRLLIHSMTIAKTCMISNKKEGGKSHLRLPGLYPQSPITHQSKWQLHMAMNPQKFPQNVYKLQFIIIYWDQHPDMFPKKANRQKLHLWDLLSLSFSVLQLSDTVSPRSV